MERQKVSSEKDRPPYQGLRLMFDVITVKLDDQHLKELDGSPASPSTDMLLARGMEDGRATVVHKIDVMHRVRTETSVVVGESRPYVVGRAKGEGEQAKRYATLRYENLGCILRLTSEWLKSDAGYAVGAKWKVELSHFLPDESIQIGEDINPLVNLEVSQQFSTTHQLGQTELFSTLAARRSAAGDGEEAVLYVFRCTFLAPD
jgi:hypothetical protein